MTKLSRELLQKLNASQAREAKLREALEYYADGKHWTMWYRPDTNQFVPANSISTSCIEVDRGRIAREALVGCPSYSGDPTSKDIPLTPKRTLAQDELEPK